jgi:uncharacterized protein YcbX
MRDCRPISLFSLQTTIQLSFELNRFIDKRRFRANIYVDFKCLDGFGEETFLGRQLKIGARAILQIVHRDVRCKIVTLDPDTAQADPQLMRHLAGSHAGAAGVYGVVIEEGIIRPGDNIVVLS